jgi:2-polyprenyl-6-methoxyphenol hydroxylase-like FAD-dependent oxidoreductase
MPEHPSMHRARRALVIGAGIGGLGAAVALSRIGMEVAVFERAPEIAEVGAGLSLWSNAMTALRRLGLEEAVLAKGGLIERVQTVSATGRSLAPLDLGQLSQRAGTVSLCMHRAELQGILLEAALAHGSVTVGRECVAIEQDISGVAAHFADGTTERGDLLIGADGIHSATRRLHFGNTPPRAAGYLCWRGIAADAEGLLPPGEVLFATQHGAQAGCFPCGAGRVYWFVTCNAPPGTASARASKAEALAVSTHWHIPIRALIEATAEDAILCNDIVDRSAQRQWGRGRVTLLGDAIHATTPNLGQGACQALEGAVILADSLSRHERTEAGLRDYEDRRRARTSLVIAASWRYGRIWQMTNPLATWLRDAVSATAWAQREGERLFERLLLVDLPELGR